MSAAVVSRPLACIAAVAAAMTFATLADASNTKHERTPVVWEGGGGLCNLPVLETPCMTLHDRNEGPLHFPYGIPYEDTDVADDEVADSRTHQFFAMCRPVDRRDPIPSWITSDDVAAGEAVGQVVPGEVTASDILELRDDWDDCWYRINEDADRRAITCDNALAGVDWDTTAVPPGVYTIYGYVYEPQYNFWILRPGVVKLHDGDPDDVGPAAAISTKELAVFRNEIAMIEGCVDALDGSTATAYWAFDEDQPGGVEWFEYAAEIPIAGDTLAFEYAPPPETIGNLSMLRVDIHDPRGRTYTSYMTDRIVVVDADGPNGCGGEGSFIGGSACGDTGESSSGSSEGSGASPTSGSDDASGDPTLVSDAETSSGTAASSQPEPPAGCACGLDGYGHPAGALVLLAMCRARRGRRRT